MKLCDRRELDLVRGSPPARGRGLKLIQDCIDVLGVGLKLTDSQGWVCLPRGVVRRP